MKRKTALPYFPFCWLIPVMVFLASCSLDDDGPLPVMPKGMSAEGTGYFLEANLDSGKTVHLLSDTLYVTLSRIWSFSNCSLKSIDMDYEFVDSTLVIKPKVNIKVNEEDCPSPNYRPDSTFKMVMDEHISSNVSWIFVKNDVDSLLDSIMLRRGSLTLDTFGIFIDSSFDEISSLPLRTKESPSVLRVLDSLTPQKFYWRTLRSKCNMRVDMCKSIVQDTIFPSYWNLGDTVLVPVRSKCASSDSIYCLESKWEYDSTSVGKVNIRPDTVWHTSTYYIEEIPSCAMVSYLGRTGFLAGSNMTIVRELFVPDETESACGPATKKDWAVYDLETGELVVERDDEIPVDSLFKIWKSADVAPDTLYADSTESK